MKSIGIIGNGFVGNAIYEGLKEHYSILVYDKDATKSKNTFEEVSDQKIIFVCVPTPSTIQGHFDLSIIKSVIGSLPKNKTIIIKSTILPSSAENIINLYPEQNFVFNPEFLTERTAVKDFKNQKRIVLGGKQKQTSIVEDMYKKVFPDCLYIKTDFKTACFIKYFCNCFFAAKVSLMNEFYQVAEKENIDWQTALEGLLSSEWVNPMHTQVPGPDGDYGFGGKCFPKDISAFMNYIALLGIDPLMMSATWSKNLQVRKNKNWLTIDGAISKKKEKKNEII